MLRPTYSGVVSTLALVLALSGGAYAATALPANSVGARQLKKGAVESAKLKSGAVVGSKVKDGSLTGADIDLTTLGIVPSAKAATTATTATTAASAAHADAAAALDAIVYRTAGGVANGSTPVAATATCPAGTRALSGGAKVVDGAQSYIVDTYPEGSTGWTTRVGASAGPHAFTAYVVCAAAVAVAP